MIQVNDDFFFPMGGNYPSNMCLEMHSELCFFLVKSISALKPAGKPVLSGCHHEIFFCKYCLF